MTETKKPKGFALLSPSRRSEIGSMGGQAVKPENRAFSVNTGLASKAGKLGGLAKKRALTDREG
jgi:general stress protein YciG